MIPLSLAQIARITGGRLDGDPEALVNRLKPGDVVLVKASRAARLEGVAADLELEAAR